MRIVVDEIRESEATRPGPRGWHDVLRGVAVALSGAPPARAGWRDLGGGTHLFVSWSPSSLTLAAALLGRPVFYLCWGLPTEDSNSLVGCAKLARLRVLLAHSRRVAVNDPVTAADVRELTGRTPAVIPYVVDTTYFQYSPPTRREDFLLAPGDNGRDETLLSTLAGKGFKIIRVTRDPHVLKRHARSPANLEVRHNVSSEELRRLYQKARAVLLPLRNVKHAAGQTSALEAIACGAPLIISQGRTAAIVAPRGSVEVCQTLAPEEWVLRIQEAQEVLMHCEERLRSAAEETDRHNGVEAVHQALVSELLDIMGDTTARGGRDTGPGRKASGAGRGVAYGQP